MLSYWRNALRRSDAAERVTELGAAQAALDRVEADFSIKNLEVWLRTWPTARGRQCYQEAVRQAHKRG